MAPNRRMNSRNAAERSAYFSRREAAAVLKRVLQGDADRRATASIKSIVYGPSVRNKKATYALVCQTLKYLPILKQILAASDVFNSNKWKKQRELIYVASYDILFGKEVAMSGDVEIFLVGLKNDLQAALARLLVREKVKHVEELILNNPGPVYSKPRYIRVNTLKMDVETAIQKLELVNKVARDGMVPDLLVLPSGTDLHKHPLVANGSVFLQGKASSMVAVALCPKPGWKVLDACAAPGNKTVHLAALMEGKGNIIACELDKQRAKLLEDTVERSGAHNINIVQGDFLDLDAKDSKFSEIRAILLDPSCSGSGVSTERLDYLLPSFNEGHQLDSANSERIRKLSSFQRRALAHALSFSAVERIVYSTCSIHQQENEDVIKSVLPLAESLNFELATPFPQWPHRGLPVFEGAEHLLRTDPTQGMEGFFIALFVRKHSREISNRATEQSDPPKRRSFIVKVKPVVLPFKKMMLHNAISIMRNNLKKRKRESKL